MVGVAESDLGQVAPGTTPVDLMAQGVLRALADCGLQLSDVDGLFVASTQQRFATLALAEYLGIVPRYQAEVEPGERQAGPHQDDDAAAAMQAGASTGQSPSEASAAIG